MANPNPTPAAATSPSVPFSGQGEARTGFFSSPPPPVPLPPGPLQPVAAVLAWVFPGAGHLFLGHTRRAILIAAGVLGLFAGGLFVGGIDCVDRRQNFFWFLGQSLAGPVALGTDYVHQHHFKALDPASVANLRNTDDLARAERGSMRSAHANETRTMTDVKIQDSASKQTITVKVPVFEVIDDKAVPVKLPPNVTSLGRVNELGTLFCTVAGFMNLICIIDAAQLRRRKGEPQGVRA